METQVTHVSTLTAPVLEPDQELGGCSRRRWFTWKVKWNAYATRTKLSNEDAETQLATIVSALPDRAIEALDTLPYENSPDRTDVKKILELLEAEYLDDINEIYESYVFFTRQQDEGEPVTTYITELRRLASTCNFGNLTERLIRDRIVCGIADKSLRKNLLSQPNLDLAKCIQLCKSSHTSRNRAEEITSGRVPIPIKTEGADLHAVSTTRSRRGPPSTGTQQASRFTFSRNGPRMSLARRSVPEQCQHCGYAQHSQRQECPALGKSCLNCGGKNHFSKVCRQARRAVHWITHDEKGKDAANDWDLEDTVQLVSSFNTADDTETLFTISTPIQTTVFGHFTVNGRLTRFQLDSGASCNVLREKDIDISRHMLRPTKMKLRVYNGLIMRPLGSVSVLIRNPVTEENFKMDFLVVSEASTAILGAKACQEMRLISIHREKFLEDANSITECASMKYADGGIHTTGTVQEPAKPRRIASKADLISAYSAIFNGELGKFEGKAHLEVSRDAHPAIMPTRRVPLAMEERLGAKLSRLEKLGVIAKQTEPVEWISSMVIAEKRDGSLRVCIDPLFLNKALMRSPYPMCTMDDILPRLTKAKIFTTIDVKSGYWHVVLDTESSHLTTFGTPKGRYRWLRLPFGLSVAADIFQKKLDEVLTGLENTARIVDDVIVWGEGESTDKAAQEDHHNHLKKLLQRVEKANVHLNAEKLKYKTQEVKFAGYILSSNGHRADPEKVRAITEMAHPTNISELRRFCGMVNYLAKYVQGLATMMEPLHQLTRKDTIWEWMPEHSAAFDRIKKSLVSAPTLAFFDTRKQTTVQCDASQHGLGAAILQDGKPVAYASRALTAAEQNYAQIEKELLAVLFGCDRFDVFTFGRLIKIESDHKPLQSIVKKPIALAPKRLQRMLLRLQRYSFELVYRKGSEMYIADTLSRLKHNTVSQSGFEKNIETIFNIENHTDSDNVTAGQLQELKEATSQDETLTAVSRYIQNGWPSEKRDIASLAW